MDNIIKDLIDLLNIKIEEINKEEQFLKDSYLYIDIYKQLFSYLNTDDYNETMDNNIYINMLLEILYKKEEARKIDESIYISSYQIINYRKNEYYEEDINYINYLKEFKNTINKLNNEYNLLLNKQESLLKEKDNRNKLHECYNRLLFCFKNNININDNDKTVINKLLEEYNYNNLDIKIIMENINLYNSKINKQDNTNINKTLDILNKKYEEYKVNDFMVLDKKEKLNNYVNSIYQEISNDIDINDVVYLLDNINFEDITYILLNVMNMFAKLLNNCRKSLIDDEIYYDNDLKEIILLEYNDYENKYNMIKEYYDQFIKEYFKEEEVVVEQEDVGNELYFALNARGTYFEEDLDDISRHDYEKIIYILGKFRDNTLPKNTITTYEATRNKYGKYRKIKYDNIRIIFKKIEDNKYLILGVMEKRETFGQRAYVRIMDRDNDNVFINDLKLNNEYYDNIIKKLTLNKRKGH